MFSILGLYSRGYFGICGVLGGGQAVFGRARPARRHAVGARPPSFRGLAALVGSSARHVKGPESEVQLVVWKPRC